MGWWGSLEVVSMVGHRGGVSCRMFCWNSLGCGSRFDDIDLPSAVKYLIASDPNLQVLGAAYLQHKCYSDSSAKKQVSPTKGGSREFPSRSRGFPAPPTPQAGAGAGGSPESAACLTPRALPQARSLQAMPKLVKLFNSPNQEVQRHATGAMRNLIYDNAENKLALVEENGIYELMRTLREPDDELRKNVTGWGQWGGRESPSPGGGPYSPHVSGAGMMLHGDDPFAWFSPA